MFDDAVPGGSAYGAMVLGTVQAGVSETVILTLWTDQCESTNDWFTQSDAISQTTRCDNGS